MNSNLFNKEVHVFAKHMNAIPTHTQLFDGYLKAVEALYLNYSNKEKKLAGIVIQYPFLLPFVCGGLSVILPSHTIRRRLIAFSALMETYSCYNKHFLIDKKQKFSTFSLLGLGLKGAIQTIIGIIVIKMLRWI